MNVTETVVLEVDTRQAKADLKQLNRDKKQAQKRASRPGQRVGRMAMRAFAFTGASAAVGKFKAAPPTEMADPIAEAMAPTWAAFAQERDVALGFSGAARRSAREEMRTNFARFVGATGADVTEMTQFATAEKMAADVEAGRNIIAQDPRFTGPKMVDVAKQFAIGEAELFAKNLLAINPLSMISKAFDYVARRFKE